MAQAKEALGETGDDDVQKHDRRKKNRGKSKKELTNSDRFKDEQRQQIQLPDSEPFPMPDTGPILDAPVKVVAPGDDGTHTSGGSSSQEHQSSLSSGDQTQAESSRNYGRKLDHTQSPQQSNTNSGSSTGRRVRSDGHIRIPSSEKVARRPLSTSDPSVSFWHPPSPNHERPTIPSITPEDPIEAGIREISEDAERLDVYHFLIHLDCHRAKAEVLQTGLSLMREIVFDLHQSHPEKRYVFPNDGWCKSIKSAMSEHADDTTIQMEGAMTITFICSVSHKYKADLIRNHNASEVIAAIETHPEAKEMCCVALECLSRKEGTQSATWREDHALDAFEAIKSVLSDPSHPGTSYAVLALYNLSTHDNFRQEFVKEHILVILVHPGVMDTLSALLQDDSVSEEVMEAITSLLQRFWVRLLEDGNAYALSLSPEAMLGALVGAMYIFGSETLHSGICELLTKIPIPTSTDLMWKQTLSDAIVNAMTRHSLVEAVQLAGLTALCSLFSDPSRREEYVADLERIAEVIVFAMENFHQNADLAAQGCLTLASICSTGDWYQDTVTKKGGAAAIVNAFRSFVINGDPSLRSKTENVRLAASSALTSLSRSNAAASVLRDSNVLVDFQNMLATNGDVYLSDPSIRTCALNLISASLIESNESPEATLDIAAKFLVQNIDEADAQMILSILSILCSRSPTAIDSIMIAGEGTGTSRVVALLEDFPENACIQENGCALLSNIYFQVPFQGELDQSTYVSIGLRSVQIRTHSAREITLISSALDNHKVNVNVVKNACEALCNFVCGLNVVVTDPVDFHVSQSVAERFSGIPKEVDSALAIHEENPEVMQPVLRLLLVAVRLLNDVEMQRYSANLIARLFEIMIRFPQDEDIHQCACSILGRFVSIENESILASMANAEGLRALLLSLQMEKETVVKFTTGILSSLLREVPTLINDVIEMAEYFQCLVNCLYRFPESVPIQAETCSILVSLATLSDSYVKAIIANSGGVNAVMLALQTHRNQSYVLEYACKALAGIAEGIPDTILFSSRENICNELLTTLAYSTNMEGVIFATMEALCEFCSRDDYFDDQLFIANAVPNIVEAMAQHVHSGDVQQAGCKLLWLLSLKNDEYKQVLGASGAIQALVTALLGHITSTAVVKEALTAIKHVSRISANKDALQQSKATDAIRLAIYSNLAESQVLSAALSALNDIAVDTSTREVTSVSDETMNSVLAATRTHPSDNEVQKIACWLLRSYTFNERNLALMRASRDELFQLLVSASSLFPEQCGERADYIIQKIY
jgi:hypothetical protein